MSALQAILGYTIDEEIRAWLIECVVRDEDGWATTRALRQSYEDWLTRWDKYSPPPLTLPTWLRFTLSALNGWSRLEEWNQRDEEPWSISGYRLRTAADA